METFQLSKQKSGSGSGSDSDSNRFKTALVFCLLLLPASVLVLALYQNSNFDQIGVFRGNAQNASALRYDSRTNSCEPAISPDVKVLNRTSDSRIVEASDSGVVSSDNILLDRIFSPGLDEKSCLSRYESIQYRRHSPHKPSPYLLSKLRKYEDLHKNCGPNSESYNRSLSGIKSGTRNISASCKYVIWIPANGLGNRIISIASTFLYALLTNRVLLLDHGKDMDDLFCEPFPDTSWRLPNIFPVRNHWKNRYTQSFASIVKTSTVSPSHLYLNLDHSDYLLDKKLFYCGKSEPFLRNVPWIMILSDQYFAPYFFLSRTYKQEVTKMFPDKDCVFNLLSSYLFNPTNQVWGLITRFYDAYLSKADQRVGLQVRVFNPATTPFQTVLNQLLNCTLNENILPETGQRKPEAPQLKTKTSKAILVTSLYNEFYVNLSNMYWTGPTATGEVIGVYQPSHEGFQQFGGTNTHNMKAWAEMYLLSLTDVLVTSAWSTFGYVGQGLGGLKPWILFKTDNENVPNPPCTRDLSTEPCFHFPPTYDCDGEGKIDVGDVLPYLRHCVDLNWGVKLVRDD
ncbi:galactoside 2-alpha-L-fucosyltransferase-like [Euphorbia lathyris]|uniref:galactoside 2-alpha-L-fucosyltransferase-like n=1 Tax=Euphorbia lathyris TaxID=212925 RepID=UPI0033134860